MIFKPLLSGHTTLSARNLQFPFQALYFFANLFKQLNSEVYCFLFYVINFLDYLVYLSLKSNIKF